MLTKILKIPIFKEEKDIISKEKRIELRALAIFQKLEYLGFYTDPIWFYNLRAINLIKYIKELYDIWNYRANLNPLAKISICPPVGNPFLHIRFNNLYNCPLDELKEKTLNIMDEFIKNNNSASDQYLGGCYLLQALTLVSYPAANSLPWLYQTVINY